MGMTADYVKACKYNADYRVGSKIFELESNLFIFVFKLILFNKFFKFLTLRATTFVVLLSSFFLRRE